MVFRIHQERERHLECIVDFRMVDDKLEAGPYPRQRRQDAKAEAGAIEIEIADRLDEFAAEAYFLKRFAQRGIERGSVGRIDLAARKGNLAGVLGKMHRALRQQYGRLRMVDDRDQDGCGADRLFSRDDLKHPIGAGIAARRNNVGIHQAGRDVETEPRAGALEKLVRADFGGGGLHPRVALSAALNCAASAVANNSTDEVAPNAACPSTTSPSAM